MTKKATQPAPGAQLRINVHHVTRVEGHGNIVVDVRDGSLERCELEIIETPRFIRGDDCAAAYTQRRTSPAASAGSAPAGTRPPACALRSAR